MDVGFRFRGNAGSLTEAGAQAERALKGVDQQAARTQGTLARTGRQADDTGRRFGYMAHYFATRAVFGLTTAIGGLGVGLGLLGFNFLRVREQATIAFTTMLQSGAKARKFLDELQAFAARTPFEFPSLVRTTQRMLAMGFAARDVVPALTAIGDQVADLGGSPEILDRVTVALGQMQLKGRVQAEEMLQLIEAGVNGWGYLAKAMGVNVAKAQDMVTKRTVSGRFAVKAILAGMEADHKGAMERQSHSFAGLWSTIKDTVSAGSGAALAPLYAALEHGMQNLVDFMATPEWTAGVKRFSDYVAAQVVPKIIGFGKAVFEFFRQNGATIAGLLGDAAHLVAALVRGSARIVGALGGIRDAAGWILGGVFAAKLIGVGTAITARLIPALLTLRNDLIGIRVASALAGTQMTFMGAAGARAMFAIRGALISTGIGALMVGLGLVAGYVVTHWSQTKEWFGKFWHWMKVGFAVLWESIKQTAKAFVHTILQIATAGIRGVLEVASHLPFVGKKARAALDEINAYIKKWEPDFAKVAAAAGEKGGNAFGQAFSSAAEAAFAGVIGAVATAGGGSGTTAGIVATAQALGPGSGKVYVRGGGRAGPPGTVQTGYDCSGYLYDIYRRNGVTIPGTAAAQFHDPNAQKVGLDDLEPGDGVYFYNHTSDPQPGHCGIVVSGRGRSATMIDYFTHGQPAETIRVADKGLPFAGGRRWIKIAQKPGTTKPTTTPPVDLSVPDFTPIAGTTKAKKATGVASVASIKAVGATIEQLHARVRVLTREGLGDLVAGVNGQLDKVSARLRKGMKTDDLAVLRRQLGVVRGSIDRAFAAKGIRDEADKMLQGLTAAFKVETPRTEAQVRQMVAALTRQLAALKHRIKAGVDADTLKVLKARLAQLKDTYSVALDEVKRITQEKLDALNQTLSTRRDSLASVLGVVGDKAFQIFDAATDRLVRDARVKVQTILGLVDIGAGEKTPAELALEAFDRQQAADQRARDRAAALAIEDPAERAARIRELDLQDQRDTLEQQAATERQAVDDALTAEQKRIQDERALVRERFAARLAEVEKGWSDEELANGTAIKQLLGLLDEYGVDFSGAGDLLGQAFATSFTSALDGVRQAILSLIEALNGVRVATGLPPIGTASAASGSGNAAGTLPFARIRAVPYQRGGLLAGPAGVPPDSLIYRGTVGERVINAEQQRWLESVGAGGGDVHFHFYGHVSDRQDMMDDIRREMLALGRRQGSKTGAIFGGRG